MSKHLQTLTKLLALLDKKTSHADLLEAFSAALLLILKIEKATDDELEGIKKTHKEIYELIEDETKLKELEKNLRSAIEALKLKEGPKGDRGDSYILTQVDKKEIAKLIKIPLKEIAKLVEIPAIEKIIEKTETIKEQPIITQEIKEVAVVETAEQIRDKLESLKEDERIDKSAIKGLEAIIEELRGLIAAMPRGRLGGMRKVPIVRAVDLTSSVDGSTSTFTLPMDTVRVLLAWSTQFPIVLRPDVDFTFSGRTLTIVSTQVGSIQTGQTLTCLIETLFYA